MPALPSNDDATRRLRSGSREPLLRVEGLSVLFEVKRGLLRRTVGQLAAIDSVDFRLLRGQTLAVVGEPGSGKTTLGRTIAGLVPGSAGRVLFEGRDVFALGQAERCALLQQIQLVTAAALSEPGALKALIALEPKLVILDEAFAAFHEAARARLVDELRELQASHGFACMVLTRDVQLASLSSDQVLVLHAGQIVESGSTALVLEQPRHPYTQQLTGAPGSTRASLPPSSARVESSEGCRFQTRCQSAFARCAQEAPTLFAVPGGLCRCFLQDPDGATR